MFDLEKTISKWKKSLHKYSSMEDGYCEELESHLRELIDEKLNAGLTEEEAFHYAHDKVGNVEEVSGEYYSVISNSNKRPPWKQHPYFPSMLTNYFKLARRQFFRNKGYSFINILGLSIGLACMIILVAFIKNELSYDNFYKNKDRLYRVYIESEYEGETVNVAPVMLPFALAIKADIPEIEAVTRISRNDRLVRNGDKVFFEKIKFADEDLLKVLSFDLIDGDINNVLNGPNKIILSEDRAKRYFGDKEPVGQTLVLDNNENFIVTGVFKNIPQNSHLRENIFASISTLYKEGLERLNEWTHLSNDFTYVLLKKNVNPAIVEQKFVDVINKNMDPEDAKEYKMCLQKITDIHLSNLLYDHVRTISPAYLYVFGIIALFILIVACINFINLATARASRRSREVGIRKTIGAKKSQLVFQFLSEAVLYVFVSFMLAFLLVYLALPDANALFQSELNFASIFDKNGIIILTVVFIFTSLISGSYPAFILSGFLPATGLKGGTNFGKGKNRFRELLVVVQFGISVFLIFSTIVIYNQIEYLVNQDLGFNSKRIGVIPIYDENLRNNIDGFKNSLSALPEIENISFSSGTPGSGRMKTMGFTPEGGNEEIIMQLLQVDEDFFNTYGLKLVEGRSFSRDFISDRQNKCLINKTALEKIGWQTAVGKTINLDDDIEYSIIGVINDFNYQSLKHNIEPAVIECGDNDIRFCSIKFAPEQTSNGLKKAKRVFEDFSSGYPFEGYVIDKEYQKYYRPEERIGQVVTIFAGFAILISCLGILGLVSFMVEQKRKEIGIRKVLGASTSGVLGILSSQFIKWVIIANVIVWPLAYYALDNWLSDFAYRIDITVFPFIIAGIISALLAILTMSYHVIKAAVSNPVESIRYE
jgi:putative ABC transport system permease protein